jgi:hypothetical protein
MKGGFGNKMYINYKKDENKIDEQAVLPTRNMEKQSSDEESKVLQVNANRKLDALQVQIKPEVEDKYSERLPKRRFLTTEKRRQNFQTKSRKSQ